MVSSEDRILNAMELRDPIDKIPKMEFSSFVRDKFAESGKKISKGALKKIVRFWNHN